MSNNQISREELESILERIEFVEDNIAGLMSDRKEIITEAKSKGYDPKYIKLLIKLRKMDRDEIEEVDELTKTYRKALGI